MARVLEKLLPYEKPQLAAITVKGDTNSPLRVQADLPEPVGFYSMWSDLIGFLESVV
jgi:hypothetical protein